MPIKKILSFIAVGALGTALLLSLVSCDKCQDGHTDADKDFICDVCGNDMPCEHEDKNGDALCDKCGEFYEAPIVYADFKITVHSDDGSKFSGVEVSIFDSDGNKVLGGTTDACGEIVGNLALGEYFVSFEHDAGDGIYIPGGYLELSESGTNSFSYTAIDNTADGSADKPFFISEDEMTYTFPAGATYNFIIKGESRTMLIENANVSVIYSGSEYTPTGGKLELLVSGPSDPSDPPTAFTVTNTYSEENEVTLRFIWKLGSQSNPISVSANEAYTTESITYDDTVYYIFTATVGGNMTLTSATEENHISMMNITTSRASDYTNGKAGSSITLEGVNAGDKILIQVSSYSTDGAEISFKLTVN